jgi:small subunit ribosomal protein S1
MKRLLETYSPELPKRGELLDGEILYIEENAILIDVGAKRDAIVPRKEIEKLSEDQMDDLNVGDQLPVRVMRTPPFTENLVVSIERGLEAQDWERASACKAMDEVLELEVIDRNRGGLLVEFGSIRGFVPNSHIPGLRGAADGDHARNIKEDFIGTMMKLKVLEVDRKRRRFILSGRQARQAARSERIQELEVGQKITGRVVNIVDFGAFVDLGGVDGLIHISELDWGKVDHPSEVLGLNEEVEVLVKSIDPERKRIGLSRKALLPNPWEEVEERYEINQLVEGTVSNACEFGVFLRLPDGIEGLIHKSELDVISFGTPEDFFRPGEKVLVRILNIEPEKERMSLSQRQVTYDEQVQWRERQQEQELAV